MKWVRPPGSLRSLSEIMVESEELESLSPLAVWDRQGRRRMGEEGELENKLLNPY